jgi:hypothetical protein
MIAALRRLRECLLLLVLVSYLAIVLIFQAATVHGHGYPQSPHLCQLFNRGLF